MLPITFQTLQDCYRNKQIFDRNSLRLALSLNCMGWAKSNNRRLFSDVRREKGFHETKIRKNGKETFFG